MKESTIAVAMMAFAIFFAAMLIKDVWGNVND